MPRKNDPAVTFRLSPAERAAVDAVAGELGVATGALLREAALWNLTAFAREVAAGRVRLRRRSGGAGRLPRAASARVPVPAAGAAVDLAVADAVGVSRGLPAGSAREDAAAIVERLDPGAQPLAALDLVGRAERELTRVKASPLRPGETIVQRNIRIAEARRALAVASGR